MRILYLLPHPNMVLTDPVGHAIRIRELIRGFEKLGGEVFVVSAGEIQIDQRAKNIYRSWFKHLPAKLSGALRDLFYMVHDNLIFRQKAHADTLASLPVDFIIEHYTFFHQTGVFLARKYNLPLILDDIPPIWEDEIYYRRDMKRLAGAIQARVFKQATALIAVSGTIRNYLLSLGVPKEKIHTIHNGADCNLFRPGIGGVSIREKFRIQNRIVVGFVGSFAPWQGIDFLIDCALDLAQSISNIHFLIVGDGPQREVLQQKVKTSNLADKITFTGSLPFSQIPRMIDAMDITIMPDANTYVSPIKIFEYMAMEKAVIAPRFDSIEEIILDGEDGLLFQPRDRGALKHAVIDLCKDEGRRLEIGQKARRKIKKRFTWIKHAKEISKIAKIPLPI